MTAYPRWIEVEVAAIENDRPRYPAAPGADLLARNRLVASSQGLVVKIARTFSRGRVPLDDLIQEGNLGLLRATETFDPAKSAWSTYASWWVRAYVRRFVQSRQMVHRKGSSRYLPTLSLDSLDEEDKSILDSLASDDEPADELLRRKQLSGQVRAALERLKKRLKVIPAAIVERRMLAESPAPLRELAEQLGISKQYVNMVERQVRQLLARQLAEIEEEHHAR